MSTDVVKKVISANDISNGSVVTNTQVGGGYASINPAINDTGMISFIENLYTTRFDTATSANTYTLPSASLTVVGGVELATTGETTTGTDATRATTPVGVQAAIDALIGGAPGALDTLNELAAALGDDENYASTITTVLALKSTIASPTFTGTVAIPNVANLETAVVANTAKVTNVSTNLSATANGTSLTVESSDGNNVALPAATTSAWGIMSDDQATKLDGIEASADVTDATNVTAAGALMDSELTDLAGVKGVTISTLQVKPSEGAFANGDKTKLDAIEASADITDTANVTSAGALMDSEVTNLADVKAFDTSDYATAAQGTKADSAQQPPTEGAFVDGDKTKLDAIEASATADQSNAEIVAAVEAGTDSNTFTDADHTKLDAIELLADVTDATNVTAAGALMDSELAGIAAVKATTGTFLTADQTKLDGIEASATADQSNAEIKTAIEAGTDIALGGNPTTTTQSAANNSTRVATTAYADAAAAGGGASDLNDLGDVSYGGTNLTATLLINNTPGSAPVHGTLAGNNSYNVGIGYQALDAITYAENNVSIGRKASTALTTGKANVCIGYQAQQFTTEAENSVSIGYDAHNKLIDGDNNVAIGTKAGYFTNNSSNNIAIGKQALYGVDGSTSSADYNVAVGYLSLAGITTGDYNVAIGFDTGKSITTGGENVFLGQDAGNAMTTGAGNVCLGVNALKLSTKAYHCIAIGYQAMRSSAGTSSDWNIAIGEKALYNIGNGDKNIAIGKSAGEGETGSWMLYIAYDKESSNGTLIKGDMYNKFLAVGKADVTLSTEDATFQVYPTATNDSAYFAKMPASHTGDLIRIDNSVGTNLFLVDKDGDITIAGTIGTGTWEATDVAILHGGTGSSTAAGARTNLGLGTAAERAAEDTLTDGANLPDGAAIKAYGDANWAGGGGASDLNDLGDVSFGGTNLTKTLLINASPGNAPTTGTLGSDCSYNLAIGDNALDAITDAQYNVALGRRALTALTTGDGCVAIGYYAGYANTADYGTFLGANAGRGHTTGAYPVYIGYGAGMSQSTGGYNVGIGWNALKGAWSSDNHGNTAIGATALTGITTGNYNVAIGHSAGDSITTGGYNINLGKAAGSDNTTLSNLLFIGNDNEGSDGTLIKGDMSNKFLAIGKADVTLATEDATLQVYPTATNDAAYFAKMPGSHTGDLIRIDNSAGTNLFKVDKDGNLTLGGTIAGTLADGVVATTQSSSDNSTKVATTAYADAAGGGGGASDIDDLGDVSFGGTNLTRSLLINAAPGSSPTTGTLVSDCAYNVAIGYEALNSITGVEGGAQVFASNNVALGQKVLTTNTTGSYNAGLGDSALRSLTTGSNNLALGKQAGYSITTGGNNILIGYRAGWLGPTTHGNVLAIGMSAGENATGSLGVTIGPYAGANNTADYATFLGGYAGKSHTSGSYPTYVGHYAGYYSTDGDNNVAVGYNALRGASGGNTTGNDGNTAIGSSALAAITTGQSNTAIGRYAGDSITTANYNIAIGYFAGGDNTTSSNLLFIGNNPEGSNGTLIKGDMANKFLAVGKADVTLSTADATLQIFPTATNDSAYFAKMPASHTGDLIRIDNNSGTNLFKVDKDGDITIAGSWTMDSVGITAIQTSGESFADNDTSLMTSAAIADKITASGGGAAADDVTVGDAAASFATSAGDVTIDSQAAATIVDGHTGVTIKTASAAALVIDTSKVVDFKIGEHADSMGALSAATNSSFESIYVEVKVDGQQYYLRLFE